MKTKMLIILVITGFTGIITLAALGFLPISGGLLYSATNGQNTQNPTSQQLVSSVGYGLQATQCYTWNNKIIDVGQVQYGQNVGCESFIDTGHKVISTTIPNNSG